MSNAGNFKAIDPNDGTHLRDASAEEIAAYVAQPARAACFRKPVRVGDVLIDEWTGHGQPTIW